MKDRPLSRSLALPLRLPLTLSLSLSLALPGCPGPAPADPDAPSLDGGSDAPSLDDAGTDAPPLTLTVCAEACDDTADCTIEGDGTLGYTCEAGRCVISAACTADATCVADANAWPLADTDGDFVPDAPCTMDGGVSKGGCPPGAVCCPFGDVCVAGGRCASPGDGVVSCDEMGLVILTVPDVMGNDVEVCGVAGTGDARCDAGRCFDPCASDEECSDETLPRCDVASGTCRCTTTPEDSCALATSGGTVCGSAGRCGCVRDADCVGTGFDRCLAGACGCSSVSACPTSMAFDGTTVVCE